MNQPTLKFLPWVVSLLVPAVAGLCGVLIGAWLSGRHDKQQRQLAYIEKQLSLFYSPLLGLRNEIRALGSLRTRVSAAADAAWQKLCTDTEHLSIEQRQHLSTERGPEFIRIIEFENDRLHKHLLPAYAKMVSLFRENYWLAEPTTREFYGRVLEFVDIWQRWADKSLPVEVLQRLGHTEENLAPFYEHLAKQHDELRTKLQVGSSDA